MGQFVLVILKLDYIATFILWLSNHQGSKAMHNMSAHQLPQYYQPQWGSSMT